MKHVEVLIANVDSKFYAKSDRCGHMNALLSMGNLTGNIVTCPFHGSKFDVTTTQEMEPLTKNLAKIFRKCRSTYGLYQDI